MKRTFLLLMSLCFGLCITLAQTTFTKHEVKKGETLESVAKQYGVTTQMIKDANPQMGSYFYVGMKLNIPEKKQEKEAETPKVAEDTSKKGSSLMASQVQTEQTETQEETKETTAGTWIPAFEIGYGFLGKDGFGYKATVGVNYKITEAAYAGIRIGYNSSSFSNAAIVDYEAHKGKKNIHLINIPIEAGYALGTERIALVPYLGLDLNIGLSGKIKEEQGTSNSAEIDMKVGGKFGVAFNAGVRLRLWGFNISGAYHIPLNEKQESFFQEDAYPEISIGFGF